MPRFAALLRGINVGGHRVSKEQLVRLAEGAGFSEVTTWRASGNLLLTSVISDRAEVEETLESALGGGLGYAVPVFVRERQALQAVVDADAFTGLDGRGKPQVIFLRTKPTDEQWSRFLELCGPDEVVELHGREIHWSPSRGVSDSEFDIAKVEQLLSPTTVRTLNTVEELLARL